MVSRSAIYQAVDLFMFVPMVFHHPNMTDYTEGQESDVNPVHTPQPPPPWTLGTKPVA